MADLTSFLTEQFKASVKAKDNNEDAAADKDTVDEKQSRVAEQSAEDSGGKDSAQVAKASGACAMAAVACRCTSKTAVWFLWEYLVSVGSMEALK